MIKKTIKYTDYNGVQQQEDAYFNMNKAEMTMLEVRYEGGLSNVIKEAVKSEDKRTILDVFFTVIKESYGVKSEDGRRFIKSNKLTEDFIQSEAYSELFVSLLSDEKAAQDFIKAIVNQPNA